MNRTYRVTVDQEMSDQIDALAHLKGVKPYEYLRALVRINVKVLAAANPEVAPLVAARVAWRAEEDRTGVRRGHLRSLR